VRIERSPAARATARRYLAGQDGMRAIGAAVAGLAVDPIRLKGSTAGTITG